MVYESDFYTSRRPYSRPTMSSYSVTRRQIDWERHPTVPRPSLVPPPVTAFGRPPVSKEAGGVPTLSRANPRSDNRQFVTLPYYYSMRR